MSFVESMQIVGNEKHHVLSATLDETTNEGLQNLALTLFKVFEALNKK